MREKEENSDLVCADVNSVERPWCTEGHFQSLGFGKGSGECCLPFCIEGRSRGWDRKIRAARTLLAVTSAKADLHPRKRI